MLSIYSWYSFHYLHVFQVPSSSIALLLLSRGWKYGHWKLQLSSRLKYSVERRLLVVTHNRTWLWTHATTSHHHTTLGGGEYLVSFYLKHKWACPFLLLLIYWRPWHADANVSIEAIYAPAHDNNSVWTMDVVKWASRRWPRQCGPKIFSVTSSDNFLGTSDSWIVNAVTNCVLNLDFISFDSGPGRHLHLQRRGSANKSIKTTLRTSKAMFLRPLT